MLLARILIVDDEAMVRAMLRDMLEPLGYDVQEACNGRAGLAFYQEAPADLVITDVSMPEMDGIALIEQLKQVNPEAKVVAIAGINEVLTSAKGAGADYIFSKPFDLRAMLQVVDGLVDVAGKEKARHTGSG